MDKNRENTLRWKAIAAIGAVVAVAAVVALIFLLKDFYGEEMESETKMEELRVSVEPVAIEESTEEAGEEPEDLPTEAPAATQEPLEKNPYISSSRTGTWPYG